MLHFLPDTIRKIVLIYSSKSAWMPLLGAGVAFPFIIAAIQLQRRTPALTFRWPFWNDAAYGLLLPFYTVLIGIPFTTYLSLKLLAHASFFSLDLLRGWPAWANILVWVLALDLMLYWLHRFLHMNPALWTVHKLHHSQENLSPLTTWRTHWLELMYLAAPTLLLGMVLGPFSGYPVAMLFFLGMSQMTQHSGLDWSWGPAGNIIISPRFHGRHHSAAPEDANVNFGTVFPFWDKMFGTARDIPLQSVRYGLTGRQGDYPSHLPGQMLYPFTAAARRVASALGGIPKPRNEIKAP